MPRPAFKRLDIRRAVISSLLILAGLGLFYFAYKKFVPSPLFKLVGPSALKGLEVGRKEAPDLLEALKRNAAYLQRQSKRGTGKTYRLGGVEVDNSILIRSTDRLIRLLKEGGGHLALESLSREFHIIKINVPVLVTGYYLPELEASKTRRAPFTHPIYSVPEDLITVRLKDFIDQVDLPDRMLRGRVEGHFLVPYYTRANIERAKGLRPIAYLKDPIEVLLLQVQGSGILTFPDGSTSYVHYAADNGYPYRSVGKILLEKGLITREQADWQGISGWFRAHPKESKEILDQNPRFIFFREEEGVGQAVGAQGVPLTPFHSIAVDPARLPFGGVYVLDVEIPGHGRMKTLVISQDKGGAIKGVDHIDLYIGRGERAGEIAGRLKSKGRLMVLIKKFEK